MTSPAKDIATILQPTLSAGADLFIGKIKEAKHGVSDLAVSLSDIGSIDDNPKWKRDECLIFITIRSNKDDYNSGYDLAYQIKDLLLGHPTVDINGSTYNCFTLQGGINWISQDVNNRDIFTMRVNVTRDGYVGGYREDF